MPELAPAIFRSNRIDPDLLARYVSPRGSGHRLEKTARDRGWREPARVCSSRDGRKSAVVLQAVWLAGRAAIQRSRRAAVSGLRIASLGMVAVPEFGEYFANAACVDARTLHRASSGGHSANAGRIFDGPGRNSQGVSAQIGVRQAGLRRAGNARLGEVKRVSRIRCGTACVFHTRKQNAQKPRKHWKK